MEERREDELEHNNTADSKEADITPGIHGGHVLIRRWARECVCMCV